MNTNEAGEAGAEWQNDHWLAIIMDSDTRRIVDFKLSSEPLTDAQMAQFLDETLEDENAVERRQGEQPMAFGIPTRIYSDNGREFSSIHNVCAQWGIELAVMSPAHIPHKGQIERLFEPLKGDYIRANRCRSLSFDEVCAVVTHFIQQWNNDRANKA